MRFGSPFSKRFVDQLSEKEVRDELVADRVKTRISLAIKALREQAGRGWSQKELGIRSDKPQSVISRIEDPDYGKHSLQTLLEIAAAFDVPLSVEFMEWDDWLSRTGEFASRSFHRQSFDPEQLHGAAATSASDQTTQLYFGAGGENYALTSANTNGAAPQSQAMVFG